MWEGIQGEQIAGSMLCGTFTCRYGDSKVQFTTVLTPENLARPSTLNFWAGILEAAYDRQGSGEESRADTVTPRYIIEGGKPKI